VALSSMEDLFLHQLQDTYMAEKKILQALPTMAKSVETQELRHALEKHHKETQGHVKRLEKVFQLIGQKPKGVECKGIDGIIGEAEEQIGEIKDKAVCEAAIVASAQALEHYEITRYGTLASWAKELGHEDAAKLLHETLVEEKKSDELLTKMAKEKVNRQAAA
jgi:ferritin-like metal-binding protein YciE